MTSPLDGLRRLRAAAESGELEQLCQRHGISVLTVFGSALRDPQTARDLDVAALPEPGRVLDLPGLIVDLTDLAGLQAVDVADLSRADPVLRERALVACVPLYESRPGAFAAAQGAAVGERVDTDANRRLNLALLAS